MGTAEGSATTAAIILAAGAGTRFEGSGHKLTTDLGGTTLVMRAAGAAVAAGIGEVAVVVGDVVAELHLPHGVMVVACPRWHEGQSRSLQAATSWAAQRGHESIVVGLGDQPGLQPEAWRAVAGATATALAVATYDGRRGHPVRLAAGVWSELPTAGDIGARAVLGAHPEWVTEVRCDGDPTDIDTVADLERWHRRHD